MREKRHWQVPVLMLSGHSSVDASVLSHECGFANVRRALHQTNELLNVLKHIHNKAAMSAPKPKAPKHLNLSSQSDFRQQI